MINLPTYEQFINESKSSRFEKVISIVIGRGTVKKVRHNNNSVNRHSEVYASKDFVAPGDGKVQFELTSGATYTYSLNFKVMTSNGEVIAKDVREGDRIKTSNFFA